MTSVRVRERDWDDVESVRSSRSHRPKTTIRRYKIPEEEVETEETRVVIREKTSDRDDRRRDPRIEYRIVERDSRDRDFSDIRSHRGSVREEDHIIIQREERESRSSSSDSSSTHRTRTTRDLKVAQSPYSLEKYSKSTEYFSQPAPQPIIIQERAAPQPQTIIIREAAPPTQQIVVRREVEPSYELVEREQVEDRPLVRRERRQEEEDYYYERRIREVERGPRRDDRHDEEQEWRRRREAERDYYSDDDAIYVRREYDEYGEEDRSQNHRRRIAEGVIGGIAAAEIVRHHRRRQGDDPGSRLGQLVGYGALGGIGANALDRYNQHERRDRDWDGERGRERSKSQPRVRAIAGVAALAGLGALAYAAGKKNSGDDRRSRSRRRRSSVRSRSRGSSRARSETRSESKHTDPEHRNRKMAQAGLVGAAAAGIAERIRSRSRGGAKSRSRSRLREGVPIVAAGVGSAAIAGLYEKQRAKKEKRDVSRSHSRSHSVSRSRSRSVPRHSSKGGVVDTALVSYGGDPIYPDGERERHGSRTRSRSRRHHRHRSSSGSLSPDRKHSRSRSRSRVAEVAAAAGVATVAAHEVNKRRERRRERERRRQEEADAAHADTSTDPYASTADLNSPYYPASNQFAPPPNGHNEYQPQLQNHSYTDPAYAAGGQMPAYNPADYGPTTGPTLPHEEAYAHNFRPQAYNQYNQAHPDAYAQGQHDPYGQDQFDAYAHRGQGHSPHNEPRNPENVSVQTRRAAHLSSDGVDIPSSDGSLSPGVRTPTSSVTPSTEAPQAEHNHVKNVQFGEDPVASEHIITPLESPEVSRSDYLGQRQTHTDREPEISDEDRNQRRRRHGQERGSEDRQHNGRRHSEGSSSRHHDRDRGRLKSNADQSEVEDLPPRFDKNGRRIPDRGEDPFADKIEDLLNSNFFQKVTDGFMGNSERPSDERRRGRERSRGGPIRVDELDHSNLRQRRRHRELQHHDRGQHDDDRMSFSGQLLRGVKAWVEDHHKS